MVAHEEKEIGQPLTTRSRKKTKVESSFFQAPVTSSVHGPLGFFDFVSQSPLGPSGRTCSKQQTTKESIEREREKGKTSFLLLSFMFVIVVTAFSPFSLLADE